MLIQEAAQRFAEKPTEARYEVLRDMILKDESIGEWIPEDKIHPDKNGNYLVQVRVSDGTAELEYIDIDHANDDGTWTGNTKRRKVVAWRLLPEMYKRGDSE